MTAHAADAAPRYRAICRCGWTGRVWRFHSDAAGEALGHQTASTRRIFVHDPLDPAHAAVVDTVERGSLVDITHP